MAVTHGRERYFSIKGIFLLAPEPHSDESPQDYQEPRGDEEACKVPSSYAPYDHPSDPARNTGEEGDTVAVQQRGRGETVQTGARVGEMASARAQRTRLALALLHLPHPKGHVQFTRKRIFVAMQHVRMARFQIGLT